MRAECSSASTSTAANTNASMSTSTTRVLSRTLGLLAHTNTHAHTHYRLEFIPRCDCVRMPLDVRSAVVFIFMLPYAQGKWKRDNQMMQHTHKTGLHVLVPESSALMYKQCWQQMLDGIGIVCCGPLWPWMKVCACCQLDV